MRLIEITKEDWEITITTWIARVTETAGEIEYLGCGFCDALTRELNLRAGYFERGVKECGQCHAYLMCVPKDSPYERAGPHRYGNYQARLEILEWLYDFGKARGWTDEST